LKTCILGIETASEVCSVALSIGSDIVVEKSLSTGMRHSSALTSLIKAVLDSANKNPKDLSAIAISDGPGSYTGLRVGASTAKAMCYALNKPLIAIPTLKSLAFEVEAKEEQYILSTLDARRMEVYALITNGAGTIVKNTHSIIWTEEELSAIYQSYKHLIICGTGVEKALDLIKPYESIMPHISTCNAKLLLPLALQKYEQHEFVDIAYHNPLYFKSPNITKSKKRILQ